MRNSQPPAAARLAMICAAICAADTGAGPLLHEATVAPGTMLEAEGNDLFGQSIAIDADTLVVGAFSDEVEILPGQGVSSTVGSVYVFRRSAQLWHFEQRLIAPDAEAQGAFGFDVGMSGERLIVGAPQHDSPDPGSAGNVVDQGAAYIYRRVGTVWTLEQKLVPQQALGAFARFGHAVAIDADTALVGAPDIGTGVVDVYRRDGGNVWPHESRLLPTTAFTGPNAFGRAVALHQHTAVVGAPTEDNGGISHPDSGAAYVFGRSGVVWTQQARLVPSLVVAGQAFGEAVAMTVDRALVGARDETVNGLSSAGAAYDFRRVTGQWNAATRLVATSPMQSERFGNSVALDGTRAAVASYWQAGSAGDQQGAVHVFADSGSGFQHAQLLIAPSTTRAAFNQFGTDIAITAERLVVGEPGFDGTSFNAGRGHVFLDDAGFVFADSFESGAMRQ